MYDEITQAVDKELKPANVKHLLETLVNHEVVVFTNESAIFNGILKQVSTGLIEVDGFIIERNKIICVWDYGGLSVNEIHPPNNDYKGAAANLGDYEFMIEYRKTEVVYWTQNITLVFDKKSGQLKEINSTQHERLKN